MDKTFKQFIKDVSSLMIIPICTKGKLNKSTLKKSVLKAIKNYSSFRLKLMQNEKITNVESKAITVAVKAGIRYAIKYYGVPIDSDKIDDAVNQILPKVLGYIQTKRVDLFTNSLKVIDKYENN